MPKGFSNEQLLGISLSIWIGFIVLMLVLLFTQKREST